MKYRKKPIIIEAIKWRSNNLKDAMEFLNCDFKYEPNTSYATKQFTYDDKDKSLYINTLEGVMKVSIGDYIIKGINGEYYPCKPDIFEKTYEVAEDKSE